MTDVIAYRGPDGDGHWISDNGHVGFGHRRLSIIDLHVHAGQPMHYLDRYTIVFNGEIYNYIELKESLLKQGYQFKTSSDTEVLMAMYDRYKEHCLQYFDGMFSFAIYDKQTDKVFIARDRFGEKPFFYAYKPGEYFLFGSELKELWAAGIEKKVDNRMVYNYFTFGYVENPNDLGQTFYEGCQRLPHSHYIELSVQDLKINLKRYYDIDWKNIDHGISEHEAESRFRELFYQSVKNRLRSDVPVGSSLSGGLDSSLVVTVMDKIIDPAIQVQQTFSAIFPGFEKDESKYMQMVIDRTAVKPHFVTPNDDMMVKDLDTLIYHQEEPFGSASIYVQYCVMKLARENDVTVLLDGQGADEVLAGYHKYYPQFFKDLSVRNKSLYKQEVKYYEDLHHSNTINPLQKRGMVQQLKEKAPFAANVLKRLYHKMHDYSPAYLNKEFAAEYRKDAFSPLPEAGTLNEALYNSTMRLGLQELLRYADRNSMAHSREVRLPFLSSELVDFLFSLPPTFKIREGWTKWIMRKTFQEELPPEITWRKDKIGYEPPQKKWMEQSGLQDKIRSAKEQLSKAGIIQKETVAASMVAEAANDRRNNTWGQLMIGEII